MNDLAFAVVITPLAPDDGGGLAATVPDLPGCMSDGDTPEDALRNVRDAIEAWIAMARELGHPVPAVSRRPERAVG